jgi:hypothetical protein
MQDITRLITDDLEYAAEWRWEKAAEFPEDADRNLEAAQTLDRMAADVKNFQGSQWQWRLQGLFDGAPERFSEVLSFMVRAVGFGSSSKTGEQFLEELCFLAAEINDREGTVVPFRKD